MSSSLKTTRSHGANPGADRIAGLNWKKIAEQLDEYGLAVVGPLLSIAECKQLKSIYCDECAFRKRIDMARHGYGRGEYQYFSYPLPRLVEELRNKLYPPLAEIANRWNEAMRIDVRFPRSLAEFLDRCHKAGQERPTPLLLKYGPGDFNCLHQDLYGEHVFPLQVAILLDKPGIDFEGGEFVLTEQRPRQQSRVEVVPLGQGQGVIFPVRHRPAKGRRGAHRVTMRHGVSRLRSGSRHTLGIIFHDAK